MYMYMVKDSLFVCILVVYLFIKYGEGFTSYNDVDFEQTFTPQGSKSTLVM